VGVDKKKVLLIDDEKTFGRLVKLNLELEGDFAVTLAESGKEGIKLARKHKPDVILLDIMMPGLDGFEVLKILKKDSDTVGIPVVMLTAKEDDESKVRAARLYDELYITKLIEPDELKKKLKEVLEIRAGD